MGSWTTFWELLFYAIQIVYEEVGSGGSRAPEGTFWCDYPHLSHWLWPVFGIKRGSKQDVIHVCSGPRQAYRWHRAGQGATVGDVTVVWPVCSLWVGSGTGQELAHMLPLGKPYYFFGGGGAYFDNSWSLVNRMLHVYSVYTQYLHIP